MKTSHRCLIIDRSPSFFQIGSRISFWKKHLIIPVLKPLLQLWIKPRLIIKRIRKITEGLNGFSWLSDSFLSDCFTFVAILYELYFTK